MSSLYRLHSEGTERTAAALGEIGQRQLGRESGTCGFERGWDTSNITLNIGTNLSDSISALPPHGPQLLHAIRSPRERGPVALQRLASPPEGSAAASLLHCICRAALGTARQRRGRCLLSAGG